MPPINRRRMLPRGNQDGAAGRLLRRSHLLGDGPAMRCAYGPGQLPNTIGNLGYPDPSGGDPAPESEARVYRAPTAWPEAGRLLRAPQVAWLSLYLPEEYETGITDYTIPIAAGAEFKDGGTLVGVGDQRPRIGPAMAGAKARVEAMRPGRTWVEILDWENKGLTLPGFLGRANYVVANSALHLSCPDEGQGFFGTDFLHVWMGGFAVDIRSVDEGGFVDYTRVHLGSYTGLGEDPGHIASVARIAANAGKFAGYRVRAYTYGDLSWETPLPPYPYPPEAPDGYNQESWTAGRDARIATIEATNAMPGSIGPANRASFAESAAVLGDPALFTVDGVLTDISEDALVALIADHYGFDAATGRDLPPG